MTGERLPSEPVPPAAGDVEVQVVRTVPEAIYAGMPCGEFTILESYLRALRSARRLIYLENQFLWDDDRIREPQRAFAVQRHGDEPGHARSRVARATRLRLWSEHLDRPQHELDGDSTDVVDRIWRPLAEQQLRRRLDDVPLTHRVLRLPHASRRTEALLGPINGLIVDG